MTPTDWIQALPLATAASWLITWGIHSTVLLAVAWGVSRMLRGRRLALEETIWRLAIVGSLVTATLQVGVGLQPLTMNWNLTAGPAEVLAAPTVDVETASRGELAPFSPARTVERILPPAAVAPIETERAFNAPTVASVAPVAPAATVETPRPFRWAAPLLALWLCGALLACLPLGLAGLRLSHYLRRRQTVRLGPAAEALSRLLRRPEVPRRTRLSATPHLAVPIALGFLRPEICLPERAGELDPPQQASLVAHETAHLVRHDPLWLLATRLLEGIFFFQPLLRVGRRRLDEIAEFRCDDWARQRTGQPSALARCLTAVAGWSVGEGSAIPVPGMVGQRPGQGSGLAQRVERLLDRDARTDQPSRWLLAAGLAVVLLAGLALPAVTLTANANGDSSATAVDSQEPEESPTGDHPADLNGGWVVEDQESEDWMAEQEEREAHQFDESGEWEGHEDAEDDHEVEWGDAEWGEFEAGDWEDVVGPEALDRLRALEGLEELDSLAGLEALEALEEMGEIEVDLLTNLEGLEAMAMQFESIDFEALADLQAQLEGMDLEDLEVELGELDLFDATGFEALADWSQDFAEEWGELGQELAGELEGLSAVSANGEWTGPDQAELHARIAAMVAESMPDRETIERLADEGRRLAERSRPDPQEIERLVSEARRLAERERPSDEEIERLREQALELAERNRPSEEELERLREQARRIAEQYRPSQEELERLQEQARALAEQHRPSQQELERLRAAAREHAERHRPSQEELEHLRSEARERAEQHRHEVERRHEEHQHEVEERVQAQQHEMERHRQSSDRAAAERTRAMADRERELAAQRRELEQRRQELEQREQALREAEERLERQGDEDDS